jgi:hypothetical protein
VVINIIIDEAQAALKGRVDRRTHEGRGDESNYN